MTVPARIEVLRQALGLTPEEVELVHGSAERLGPEIERWVERFYGQLAADPVAREILGDESRVIRLRRTLTAWLQELLSLPLDEAYERSRREIGRTHARLGMPEYLMVTSMGGLRRDITHSIARLWGEGSPEAWRIRTAVGKVLDVELALMLDAYGRRQRELRVRRDRALHAERTARRFARATHDAVDAALCWLDLLERQPEGPRHAWAARLREALLAVAPPPAGGPAGLAVAPREPVAMADLCSRALASVSMSSLIGVDVEVEPPGLVARVHAEPLQIALEELLQTAVNHGPGGVVHLRVRGGDGGVAIEVTDQGPGWPPGVRSVDDAIALEGGSGLSYCEFVAELHGGTMEIFVGLERGAGVRLRLPPEGGPEGGARDAPVAADSDRRAP